MIYFTIIQAVKTGTLLLLMEGSPSYVGAREIAEGGLVDGHMVCIVTIDGRTDHTIEVEEL